MPIVAKSGTDYKPAPAGTHSAVCVDVVDLGILAVTYAGETKEQHKIEIVWQIAEDRDDGKPYTIKRRYTCSLHEKASLRRDLESWRGKPFTDEECQGFDIEVLIGVPCMLGVVHNTTAKGTFANPSAIMQLPKGMPKIAPRDYVRVCDRAPDGTAPPNDFGGVTDDDVPF